MLSQMARHNTNDVSNNVKKSMRTTKKAARALRIYVLLLYCSIRRSWTRSLTSTGSVTNRFTLTVTVTLFSSVRDQK